MAADIYILVVKKDRRERLFYAVESERYAAEAVEEFSSNPGSSSIVVLVSFRDGLITHLADGRKGRRVATGLNRLNLDDVDCLDTPIKFDEILSNVQAKYEAHLKRRFENGGILPPKTCVDVAEVISNMNPSISYRLTRFSKKRLGYLKRLKRRELENLSYQKESLSTALSIAGISGKPHSWWDITDGVAVHSYLDGLPQQVLREDTMLINDMSTVPGFWSKNGASNLSRRIFINRKNPDIQLTVTMANRTILEEQTGADLIYFNETHRNFIMVQYKVMSGKLEGEPAFRWKSGDQFAKQIATMDRLMQKIRSSHNSNDPKDFRFTDNPFFLKICPRIHFDPDEEAMIKGMYLPIDYWKKIDQSSQATGPRQGKAISYRNIGRYINNTDFVTFVSGAWVGTSSDQSAYLEEMIRTILKTGKSVTLASLSTSDKRLNDLIY